MFNDYVQPNTQVEQKQLDVNYFQTLPYLETFNREQKTHLIPIVGVHIEPLGAYSRKHKALADLPTGAWVAIPNESSNEGRALLLLQKAGLITLKDLANPLSTLKDIATNPKGLKFRELEAATPAPRAGRSGPGADQHQLRPRRQAGPPARTPW